LTSLVNWEKATNSNSDLSFNIQDPDPVANPLDNPDHYATGAAMLEVAQSFPGANVTLYCDYYTALNPANVCSSDTKACATLQNKSAVFAETSFAVADASWPSTWDPNANPSHTNWLSRLYMRPRNGPETGNYCHALDAPPLPQPMIVPTSNGFAP
jgi:hypothetical protein